jgi:hypothetical protein
MTFGKAAHSGGSSRATSREASSLNVIAACGWSPADGQADHHLGGA